MTMSGIKRAITGLIGLAGLYGAYWIFAMWSTFKSMGTFGMLVYALLVIGGLNWFVASIQGDGNKDLLNMVGL